MASTEHDGRELPCPVCDGEGGRDVPAPVFGYRPHPNVATRWEWRPCEECQGTGHVRCVGCGEPAVWETEAGPECRDCTRIREAVERRALRRSA